MRNRVAATILDWLVNEQVWFRLSRPGMRPWLSVLSLVVSGAGALSVLSGLILFHRGAQPILTTVELLAGTALFCLIGSPLSHFLYIEQQRDVACDRYRAMVALTTPEPERAREAVSYALMAADKLTAVKLVVGDLGLPLDEAKAFVDEVERKMVEAEATLVAPVPL